MIPKLKKFSRQRLKVIFRSFEPNDLIECRFVSRVVISAFDREEGRPLHFLDEMMTPPLPPSKITCLFVSHSKDDK